MKKITTTNCICRNCEKPFHRCKSNLLRVVDKENIFCCHDCRSEYCQKIAKPTTRRKIKGKHKNRFIAESILGRKLLSCEIVHHIDENCKNDTIDNLAVLPNRRYHYDVHYAGKNFDKYKLSNIIVNGETTDKEPEVTTCIRGHEFTKDNTYYTKTGRGCRTCVNEYHRKRRADNKK